jgi:hypothetical protein
MPKQINKNNKNLLEPKNASASKKFNKKLSNVTKTTDASNKSDDDPEMKILNERLEKIEELVENLSKTTRNLASISKVFTSIY